MKMCASRCELKKGVVETQAIAAGFLLRGRPLRHLLVLDASAQDLNCTEGCNEAPVVVGSKGARTDQHEASAVGKLAGLMPVARPLSPLPPDPNLQGSLRLRQLAQISVC